MNEALINCPLCGRDNALGWYQGTENGAPHGAGFWPMQVSGFNQDCDCEIDENVLLALENSAWQGRQLADVSRDLNITLQQLSGLKKAVLRIQAMPAPDRLLALDQLSHSCYDDDEDFMDPLPTTHAPDCECGQTILCIPRDRSEHDR